MDENGTYRWPGNQPKRPIPHFNLKKLNRILTVIAVIVILASLASE